MDTIYEPYWHQAMELRHETHDLINDYNHPVAQVLHHETNQLVEDIEMHRKPRAIEDRIKQIQRQLIEARAQGTTVLNADHNQYLHHNYDQLRSRVRQMPHY
jgi:hypothetical protein